MEIPEEERVQRGLAPWTPAQWKKGCNGQWAYRKSQLHKHYQGRVRCDDFNEALMRVGDQHNGENLSSRERRKLARQQ
eukprot:15375847-Alexandrium_andersonii.AAC.1